MSTNSTLPTPLIGQSLRVRLNQNPPGVGRAKDSSSVEGLIILSFIPLTPTFHARSTFSHTRSTSPSSTPKPTCFPHHSAPMGVPATQVRQQPSPSYEKT